MLSYDIKNKKTPEPQAFFLCEKKSVLVYPIRHHFLSYLLH